MAYILAGQRITAASLSPTAWAPLTLQNSWVNSGGANVTAQSRFLPVTNSAEVIGIIKNGTVTAGTLLFTIPYTPATVQVATGVIIAGTGAGTGQFEIVIHTDGTVNIGVAALTGATIIGFHFTAPLDA